MQADRERIHVAFHNRASEVVNNLFRQFREAVAGINRLQDEHVFQLQLGKYTSQLKHNLDQIAIELLSNVDKDINPNEWNHILSGFIDQYMQEFRLKAKSL